MTCEDHGSDISTVACFPTRCHVAMLPCDLVLDWHKQRNVHCHHHNQRHSELFDSHYPFFVTTSPAPSTSCSRNQLLDQQVLYPRPNVRPSLAECKTTIATRTDALIRVPFHGVHSFLNTTIEHLLTRFFCETNRDQKDDTSVLCKIQSNSAQELPTVLT